MQNGTIMLCTYVGAVFVTASLWLGNYMDKSKGTRSIRIPFALGPYLYPFTISVADIVISNRETLYRNRVPHHKTERNKLSKQRKFYTSTRWTMNFGGTCYYY